MAHLRRPISSLVYVARRGGGQWEYLLLRRTPRAGGFWQGVTGALKEGESPADAAVREAREETGLVIEPRAIDFVHTFEVTEEEWHGGALRDGAKRGRAAARSMVRVVEQTFLAVVDSSTEPLLSREHDRYCWCRLDEALSLLKYEGNKEALRRCAIALAALESA